MEESHIYFSDKLVTKIWQEFYVRLINLQQWKLYVSPKTMYTQKLKEEN